MYLKRIELANEKFGGMRSGWKTDRGRVYLLYGEPDDIERMPSTNVTQAYQIWHYEKIQGGVEFIFADLRGFNRYDLLHSTARGERRNNNWRNMLEKSHY